MQASSDAAPRLRRDAQRNRQLLIEAATEILREQGLDAPLDDIARRAGVGNATLYRRFPTREDLYEAVFAEAVELVRQQTERVLAIEDGWEALRTYFESMGEFMATDRGLSELMAQRMSSSPALNEVRLECDRIARTLLERAQRQGSVRADIGLTDLLLVIHSLHRVIPASAAVAPEAWRRHLALTLDGLRPHPDTTLPDTRISYEQLLRIAPPH